MVSGFLIAAAVALEVLAAVPRGWYACAVAVALIVAHTGVAEVFGRGGPFWWYHWERFRLVRLPYLLGLALFAGLTALLCALAVRGFLYDSPWARGALFGAWAADGLLSHVLLRLLFRGPNPGLRTALLYLVAAPIGLRLFSVTAGGVALGAAPFLIFHSVSFARRAAPHMRERIVAMLEMPVAGRGARLRAVVKWAAAVIVPALLGVGGGVQMGKKARPAPAPAPLVTDEQATPINYEGARYHGEPEHVESNGRPWPTKRLTYWIDYTTVPQLRPALTNDAVSAAFKQAWGWWAESLDIDPVEVADPSQALVTHRFERMDGPNGVLAESYLADGTLRPKSQRYDASERWTVGPPAAGLLSLPTVACHEIGHVLGLGHDDATAPAVMRPVYSASLPREQVRDIDRMVQLGYARRPKAPPAPTDVLSFPVQVKTDDVINALLKSGYTVTKP